jgi:ABC-type dipeptide/oligopeptide/nickel transport system permease component
VQIREYILRRLMIFPLIIVGTSIIVFTLSRVGGNPVAIYLEHEMTPAEVAELEERYGLDEPLPVQYLAWARGVITGDMGWSAVSAQPVTDALLSRVGATLEMSLFAAIVAITMGIGLGTFGGARRDRLPDHLTRVLSISGASMPIFWFAILLLILFWVNLGWFSTGRSTPGIFASIAHPTGLYTVDAIVAGNLTALFDALKFLVLPSVTLGFGAMAIIARMMRSSLVEELNEDYVDAARAKGLPERLVLRRHARRNALIPTVTVIGLGFGFLLQGTVVVEIIFRWPGIGRWMADAVLRGDQATIMAYVLFTSILFLTVNMIVDVMYAYLDRRVVLGA